MDARLAFAVRRPRNQNVRLATQNAKQFSLTASPPVLIFLALLNHMFFVGPKTRESHVQ
jgi:hypothetical protein